MSDITYPTPAVAAQPSRHPVRAVVEAAEAAWQAVRKAHARRRAVRHLMEMSTRELKDIGVTRAEIYARVYGIADPTRRPRGAGL